MLIVHLAYCEIVLAVFNNAVTLGEFPKSWLETSVSLLLKKGIYLIWRTGWPISLINTDAKAFTRIIRHVHFLIIPYQADFLHGHFIADNGLLIKLLMEHARPSKSQAIGLLLDQEKAYDRVHTDYLCQVLCRFGFLPSIVRSLTTLFFTIYFRLNINGFFSQRQVLRLKEDSRRSVKEFAK